MSEADFPPDFSLRWTCLHQKQTILIVLFRMFLNISCLFFTNYQTNKLKPRVLVVRNAPLPVLFFFNNVA